MGNEDIVKSIQARCDRVKRKSGRPKQDWIQEMKEHSKIIGMENWKKEVNNDKEHRKIIKMSKRHPHL